MKKALAIFSLVLVVAGTIAFTMRRAGAGAQFPASRAAELAPAETIAFLQVPDFERTLERWPNGALHAITQEPAWEEFMARWRKTQNPEFALFFRALPAFHKARPAGFFVAVTELSDEPIPKLVGGISFRGKRTEIESAVRIVKDELLARWPGAKSELSSHAGIEIETISGAAPPAQRDSLVFSRLWFWQSRSVKYIPKIFPPSPLSLPPATSPKTEVHLAYRDDWLFFATDRSLLTGTLDRYLGTARAAASLAGNPLFVECRKHEAPEADVVAWEHWAVGVQNALDDWTTFFERGGEKCDLQALHHTWRLDGAVPDRIYAHLEKAPPAMPPVKRSPALTTRDTLGYAALHLNVLHSAAVRLSDWPHPGSLPILSLLERLPKEETWQAFEPEVTVILLATARDARPSYVVALAVRDPERARKLTEKMAAHVSAPKMTADGKSTLWDWQPMQTDRYPAPLILTKSHLLLGPSRDEVLEVARRVGQAALTLEANPDHAAAGLGIDPPNGAFLYVDTAGLFRGSGCQRPTLAWRQGPWDSEGPLFPNEAVARHLRPGTLCIRAAGPGLVIESTLGPIGNHLILRLLAEDLLR